MSYAKQKKCSDNLINLSFNPCLEPTTEESFVDEVALRHLPRFKRLKKRTIIIANGVIKDSNMIVNNL